MGDIKVLIGGRDVTDYLAYEGSASWSHLTRSRGTCSLPFIVRPDESLAPALDAAVLIYNPKTTIVWRGTVNGLSAKWKGDDGYHVVTVQGTSLEQQVDTAQLDKVKYVNTDAGSIFSAIFTAAQALGFMAGLSLGRVDTGELVKDLEVTGVGSAYDMLATISGFVWYVDPVDATLNYHRATARAAPWTVGSTDILWETAEWSQTRDNFANQQVIQVPASGQLSKSQTFSCDGFTSTFTLDEVPEYIVSADVSPIGIGGSTKDWKPGTAVITVIPPPPDKTELIVKYVGTGQEKTGTGAISRRYTLSRALTKDGAVQEAVAMLAQYSAKPSQLVFQTDKPGISVGRVLTIAIVDPLEAPALLNGQWYVQEVDGTIVPGLEQLDAADYPLFDCPVGNFRYTARLVNTSSIAVFQGDGATTAFTLPITPSTFAGGAVTPNPLGIGYSVVQVGSTVTVTPAPTADQALVVGYGGEQLGDAPTFVDFWKQLAATGEPTVTARGDPAPPADPPIPDVYQRTLTIYDTAVGNNIAPNPSIFHDGTGMRVLATLRKTITADLTIRINKVPTPDDVGALTVDIITFTIPSGYPIDSTMEFSLLSGSPATFPPFWDKQVLVADILESDGSKDKNGIASVTVEWTNI